MSLTRRSFNRQLLGVAAVSVMARAASVQASLAADDAPVQKARLAAGYAGTDGATYGVSIHDTNGRELIRQELPSRLHDCVFHPHRPELVVFDRRPGTHMHVLGLKVHGRERRPLISIASTPGRHFYGHGCFDASGRVLYVTENDYDSARGIIGVYDAERDYQRTGEFASQGIGPHDISLMADGRTLVIANGGIETHPDTGREKLNLFDMRSTLALIDSRNGGLIRQYNLPTSLQRLSLRHLALDSRGHCCFGGQYEGAPEDLPPLVGSLSPEGKLALWESPAATTVALRNYISSISAIPGTPYMATSSSHGGITLIWNSLTGTVEHTIEAFDGSGVAGIDGTLYISSGDGSLRRCPSHGQGAWVTERIARHAELHWDNHLVIAG